MNYEKDSIRIEYEKKYHLIDNKQFKKVISCAPLLSKYVIKYVSATEITDVYYDTPEMFLRGANIMFRTRVENGKKYITIKTNFQSMVTPNGNYTKVNEFETEIPLEDEPIDHKDLIIKHIPLVYYTVLKTTLNSILNTMRPILKITYKKNIYHILKNQFKAEMLYLNDVKYFNMLTNKKAKDNILEIQLYKGDINIDELLILGKTLLANIKQLSEYNGLKFDIALQKTK